MPEQRKKLMQMIGVAVSGLDRVDATLAAVAELGKRHGAYGFTDEHYDSVGAALLWTLEKGLGEQFTPELMEAWATVYGLLANTMKGGGRRCLKNCNPRFQIFRDRPANTNERFLGQSQSATTGVRYSPFTGQLLWTERESHQQFLP
jgi:hypothetical protein